MATVKQVEEYRKLRAQVAQQLDVELADALQATKKALEENKDTVGMFEEDEDE